MEFRNLGRSGLQVSVVGLGCNNFGMRMDPAATEIVVNKAIDSGINLFDTADVYGGQGRSEEFLGKALGARRHDIVLATKFGNRMGEGPYTSRGSRRYIINAVEASLRRLNTDYIDLYQMHVPDPTTPIDETLRALDDLVKSGKVRYIGHSNFTGWMAAEAHYVAAAHNLTPFISAQNEYSLLNRRIENELVPACTKFNVGVLPYFPLASGFLTGKYRQGEAAPQGARLSAGPMAERVLTDRNFETLEKLEEFARSRERGVLDVAFGWLIAQPHVGSVIAGATKPEQIDANIAAGEWRMSADEVAEVDNITKDSKR